LGTSQKVLIRKNVSGAPEQFRAMFVKLHAGPKVIKDNGDGSFLMESKSPCGTTLSFNFKLGEEMEHDLPNEKHKVRVRTVSTLFWA